MLERQIISLNLGQGIDNATDIKVGPDNKFNALENCVYNKLQRIDKRYGKNKLSKTKLNDVSNAVTIGTTAKANDLFVHKNELLMQNNGSVYSYTQDQDKWVPKGYLSNINVDAEIVAGNKYSLKNPAFGELSNVEVVVYESFDNVNQLAYLNYSATDILTGIKLVSDVQIASRATFVTEFGANVLTFPVAGKMFIIYYEQNGAGCDLKIREVSLTTGVAGSATVLKNKASGQITWVDVEYTNKTGVGERYFILANSIDKLFALKSDGTIDASIPEQTIAAPSFGKLHYNATADVLFLGTFSGSVFVALDVDVTPYTFTTNSMTSGTLFTPMTFSGDENFYATSFYHICFSDDPTDLAKTYVFVEQKVTGNYLGKISAENVIYKAQISSVATTIAQSQVGRSLALISEPFIDATRETIYLICSSGNDSTNLTMIQQTCFVVDALKGRVATDHTIAAMLNDSLMTNVGQGSLKKPLDQSGNVIFYCCVRNRIISENDGLLNFQSSIQRVKLDIYADKHASHEFLCETTHMSGGFISSYDGKEVVENNFFIAPELLEAHGTWKQDLSGSLFDGTTPIKGETDTSVAGYAASIFSFGNANLYGPGAASGNQTILLTHSSTSFSGNDLQISIQVDGGPFAAGTDVLVQINSFDTGSEVALKVRNAIASSASGATYSATVVDDYKVRIYRYTGDAGVVTAAVLPLLSGGVLPDANYSYTCIWSYQTVNGLVIRSAAAPSVSTSVASFDAKTGKSSVIIHTPAITNRDITQIKCELFRTVNNGTVFYKVDSFDVDQSFPTTTQRLIYNDTLLDADLIGNQPLYTTGGVLENAQLPACKHLSIYKNRVVATGFQDNNIYYSKTSVNGAPLEFTKEGFITLDNDSDPITGHAQMDDKLVVFKKNKIIAISGDGANDLGANVSFSQPWILATDVGCINHNSIVLCPLGLMFQSEKGIYLLDRKLQTQYIGMAVKDFNQYSIGKSDLLKSDEKVAQIRMTFSDLDKCLVFDYQTNRWSVFTQSGGDDAVVWKELHAVIKSNGDVYVENKSLFKDVGQAVETFTQVVETQWMQLKDVQDFQRIYRLAFIGGLKSAHTLNVKAYYDYDDSNYDEYNFISSNITGSSYNDSVYQPMIHLKRQKCQAIKLRVEVIPTGGTEECLTLTDMSFEAGMKRGMNKVKAAKRL